MESEGVRVVGLRRLRGSEVRVLVESTYVHVAAPTHTHARTRARAREKARKGARKAANGA